MNSPPKNEAAGLIGQDQKPALAVSFNNTESNKENLLRKAKLISARDDVRAARWYLYRAQFGIDGFDCLRLADIVDHVSLLLSDWRLAQRRPPVPAPPEPSDPEWVAMWDRLAEREWRRQRARRERR